jgi:hypothetical protein
VAFSGENFIFNRVYWSARIPYPFDESMSNGQEVSTAVVALREAILDQWVIPVCIQKLPRSIPSPVSRQLAICCIFIGV